MRMMLHSPITPSPPSRRRYPPLLATILTLSLLTSVVTAAPQSTTVTVTVTTSGPDIPNQSLGGGAQGQTPLLSRPNRNNNNNRNNPVDQSPALDSTSRVITPPSSQPHQPQTFTLESSTTPGVPGTKILTTRCHEGPQIERPSVHADNILRECRALVAARDLGLTNVFVEIHEKREACRTTVKAQVTGVGGWPESGRGGGARGGEAMILRNVLKIGYKPRMAGTKKGKKGKPNQEKQGAQGGKDAETTAPTSAKENDVRGTSDNRSTTAAQAANDGGAKSRGLGTDREVDVRGAAGNKDTTAVQGAKDPKTTLQTTDSKKDKKGDPTPTGTLERSNSSAGKPQEAKPANSGILGSKETGTITAKTPSAPATSPAAPNSKLKPFKSSNSNDAKTVKPPASQKLTYAEALKQGLPTTPPTTPAKEQVPKNGRPKLVKRSPNLSTNSKGSAQPQKNSPLPNAAATTAKSSTAKSTSKSNPQSTRQTSLASSASSVRSQPTPLTVENCIETVKRVLSACPRTGAHATIDGDVLDIWWDQELASCSNGKKVEYQPLSRQEHDSALRKWREDNPKKAAVGRGRGGEVGGSGRAGQEGQMGQMEAGKTGKTGKTGQTGKMGLEGTQTPESQQTETWTTVGKKKKNRKKKTGNNQPQMATETKLLPKS
ncbi:hypothetical protein EX30DRAFT_399017 [Ascodesmis nigricans]|uniref:Uncharacterized protein n=1 Tax=Ascodesmis nigricans TaxID=341454 RepID=A0A4S2MQJ2_9PEZI|nr:hypothetical protein EX30DRAFT_399017 [Ascodesmis nigricans]